MEPTELLKTKPRVLYSADKNQLKGKVDFEISLWNALLSPPWRIQAILFSPTKNKKFCSWLKQKRPQMFGPVITTLTKVTSSQRDLFCWVKSDRIKVFFRSGVLSLECKMWKPLICNTTGPSYIFYITVVLALQHLGFKVENAKSGLFLASFCAVFVSIIHN